MPYETVAAKSMRAVTEVRGFADIAPVYQLTVLAAVALTRAVAVVNGGPTTRWAVCVGLTSKKLCAAWTVEAAVNCVAASVRTAFVSAACRLAAVAAGVAPTVNELTSGGVVAVAVIVSCCVVPSGRLNIKLSVSPTVGFTDRSTEIPGGVPVGPMRLAPVSV